MIKKIISFSLVALGITSAVIFYFAYYVVNYVIAVQIYSENVPEAFYSDMRVLAGDNYIYSGGGGRI